MERKQKWLYTLLHYGVTKAINYYFFSYRYRRSRRTGISLGGSSRSRNRSGLLRTGSANGTKPSIFRSAKDSILSRKKPYQRKTVSEVGTVNVNKHASLCGKKCRNCLLSRELILQNIHNTLAGHFCTCSIIQQPKAMTGNRLASFSIFSGEKSV